MVHTDLAEAEGPFCKTTMTSEAKQRRSRGLFATRVPRERPEVFAQPLAGLEGLPRPFPGRLSFRKPSSSVSSFPTSLSLGSVSVLSVFVILMIASLRPCLLSSISPGKRPDGNCSQVPATLGTPRVLAQLSKWTRVCACACVRTCPREGRRLQHEQTLQ